MSTLVNIITSVNSDGASTAQVCGTASTTVVDKILPIETVKSFVDCMPNESKPSPPDKLLQTAIRIVAMAVKELADTHELKDAQIIEKCPVNQKTAKADTIIPPPEIPAEASSENAKFYVRTVHATKNIIHEETDIPQARFFPPQTPVFPSSLAHEIESTRLILVPSPVTMTSIEEDPESTVSAPVQMEKTTTITARMPLQTETSSQTSTPIQAGVTIRREDISFVAETDNSAKTSQNLLPNQNSPVNGDEGARKMTLLVNQGNSNIETISNDIAKPENVDTVTFQHKQPKQVTIQVTTGDGKIQIGLLEIPDPQEISNKTAGKRFTTAAIDLNRSENVDLLAVSAHNFKPILVPNQTAIAADQPAVVQSQLTTAADQPAVVQNQPTTAADQPAVVQNQPTTAADKPAVAPNQPTIAADKPVVVQSQPTIAADKPAVVQSQPAIVPDQPVVVQSQPTTAADQPAVVQSQPTTVTDKPVVVQSQPTTAADKPAVVQSQPTTAADQPAVVQSQPTTAADKPVVVQSQTTIVPDQPVVVQSQPAIAADKPVVVQNQPTTAADQPVVVQSQPTIAADKPAVVQSQPTTAADQPVVVQSQPTIAADKPAVVQSQPASDANQPISASVPTATPSQSIVLDKTAVSQPSNVQHDSVRDTDTVTQDARRIMSPANNQPGNFTQASENASVTQVTTNQDLFSELNLPAENKQAKEKKQPKASTLADAIQSSGIVRNTEIPITDTFAVNSANQIAVAARSAELVSKATTIAETFIQAANAITDTIMVTPELLTRREGQIEIKLKDDVLDGSSLKITVTGRNIDITFTPSTPDIAKLLEINQARFEEHLATHISNFRSTVSIKKYRKDEI